VYKSRGYLNQRKKCKASGRLEPVRKKVMNKCRREQVEIIPAGSVWSVEGGRRVAKVSKL
jgi:hypothetical protein